MVALTKTLDDVKEAIEEVKVKALWPIIPLPPPPASFD